MRLSQWLALHRQNSNTTCIHTIYSLNRLYKSFLESAPIPEHKINVDEELKYIFKTDQKGRKAIMMKVLFQPEEKYMNNYKVIAVSSRDSVRLSRVTYLDTNNLIMSDQAKFYSGIIYLHSAGVKVVDDSMYLRRSSELFEYLMKTQRTKKLKKKGAKRIIKKLRIESNGTDKTS